MKHRIAVKRPGEPLEFMDFEGTYRIDVEPLISTDDDMNLQFVVLSQKSKRILCFACDECGAVKELPFNFTFLSQYGRHSFLEKIMGTVVFLVYDLEDSFEHEICDYELRSLNDDDIDLIERLISEKAQKNAQWIAERDPHVTTENKVYFEPVEDLAAAMGLKTTDLFEIPSYLIAAYLFRRWPTNKPVTFFADSTGQQEIVAGIKALPFSRDMEIYCDDKRNARSFSFKQPLTTEGISEENSAEMFAKFMHTLFTWKIKPIVYVSAETLKLFQSGK